MISIITAKWGDQIEVDLQPHTSYFSVTPDSGPRAGEMVTVSMNNKYLVDLALQIIKELT